MTLDSGTLSFSTVHGEVFRAPVGAIDGEFGLYSTLTLTTGGARYKFVTGAYAGGFPPRFSDQQLAELTGDASQAASKQFSRGAAILVTSSAVGNVAVLVGSVVGRGTAIVGQAVAVVDLFRSQHAGFALAKAWAEYLASHGVAMRMRGTTFARSQLVIAAIVIPSLVVFGFAVYALVSALS